MSSPAPTEHAAPSVRPAGAPRLSNLPPLGDIVETQSARAQVPPMGTLEGLIGQNQWARVVELLEPCADVMPAAHQLLYAVALRESGAEGDLARRADALSIRALATLLDVPDQSPVALMLARRVQRRNWRQAPAPKPRVQFALVVAAVVIGAFVGWVWDEWNDRRATARTTRAPAAASAPAATGQ